MVFLSVESASKRFPRTFVQDNGDDDAASQGSAGGVAPAASSGAIVSTAATEMDGEEEMTMVAVAEAEAEVVGSAETEENVQRILLAIDNFTRKVRLFTVSYTPVPPCDVMAGDIDTKE